MTAEKRRREVHVNAVPRNYISFLLRLYRVREQERWIWRASLEDPLTSERRTFPNLSALFAFLNALTEGQTEGRTPNQKVE